MDLVQSKLTRSEWNSIEVSVPEKERRIITVSYTHLRAHET